MPPAAIGTLARNRAPIAEHPALSAEDEALLVRAIAAGDEAAFSRIVAQHLQKVRAVANGYLANVADADEVAQDVFMVVWRSAGNWDPEKGKFATWLYRITVNKCIDRHRKRRPGMMPIDDVAHGLAGEDDPERAVAGRQALSIMRGAIAALPERQRIALLLSVSAGLGNGEIAQALGISRGAVEQLLVRARVALRNEHRKETGDDQA